jgi:hypothetical protein
MVYSINPKIKTLDEVGVKYFLQELSKLKEQNHIADQKNRNWFDVLPNSYEKYPEWFFLFDDDKPVAFSTIQQYYPGCYRICTRTYIYMDYRRFTHPKVDTVFSPSQHLALAQLQYLKNWDSVFVSMQGLRRRNAIKRFKTKIEYRSGLEWIVPDGMFQTCGNKMDPDCFQNIVYNGEKPKLESISLETYGLLHG